MMTCITLMIEPLAEGGFVATSKEVQGLVAQGKTMDEVIAYARDVAKVLLEDQKKRQAASSYHVPDLHLPRCQDLVIAV